MTILHTTFYMLQNHVRRRRPRFGLLFASVLLILLLPVTYFISQNPNSASANWFNDHYAYRQRFTFTHDATISAERAVTFSLDTAELIAAGVMQADCDDTRFTDINGKVLPFELTGTCDNAATTYEVIFPSIINGTNVGYVYYGHPGAANAEINSTIYTALTPSGGDPSLTDRTNEAAAPGPLAYWKMDEGGKGNCPGGNSVCDATGHGKHMSIGTNNTYKASSLCINGTCIESNGGTTSSITRTDDNDFDIGAGESFTITGWFNHTSTAAEQWLFGKNDTTAGGYRLYMNSSGNIVCGIDDDGTSFPEDSATSPGTYNDNQWHHVACVKDGDSTLTLYIDNVQVAQDSSISATGSLANTHAIKIGSDTIDGGYSWTGLIDEFKFYKYARTTEEIQADKLGGGGTVLGAQDQSLLSDGLVGYWDLDESSANTCTGGTNDACDSSGNGFDGTWDSGATTSVGKFGNGVVFDGTDDTVSVAYTATLAPTTAISYGAWFEVDDDTLDIRIISKTQAGGYNLGFNDTISNALTATVNVGGSYYYLSYSNDNIETNTWYHAFVTYDGETLRLYLNGVLVDENTDPSGAITYTQTNELCIGGEPDNTVCITTNEFAGTIDEARIYNRALSPSEIRILYQWAPGPVAYFPLDENSGTTTVYDRAGNGLTGTMNGSMTESDWVTGKFGRALDLDGSDDDISISGLMGSSANVTVMGWVDMDGYDSSGGTLISIGDSVNLNAYHDGYNGVAGTFYDGSDWSNASIQLTDYSGTGWHHLAYVIDDTNNMQYLYVDGQLADSDSISTDSISYNQGSNTFIGQHGNGETTWELDGRVDEIKIYNYARTQAQITEDMNGGHPLGGSPIGSQAAHLKFDEGYGTTAYDTLGTNNATLQETAAWSTSGKFGNALLLDGTTTGTGDSHVRFANDVFDSHTEGSICTWFNPAGTGDTDKIIFGAAEDNDSFLDYMSLYYLGSSSGAIYFEIANEGTAAFEVETVSTVPTGQWTHLCATVDNSGNKIYINGQVQTALTYYIGDAAANAWFSDIAENTTSYTIGCQDTDGADTDDCTTDNAMYEGLIDDFKIYSAALTPEQVLIDMNANATIHFGGGLVEKDLLEDTAGNGPIAHWAFDENTGTGTTYDKTGNGYDGTIGSGAGADSSDPKWTQGKYGSGIRPSSGDYINIGDQSALDLGATEDATIMGWFYRESGGPETFYRKWDLTPPVTLLGHAIGIESSGELSFYIGDGTDDYTLTSTSTFNSTGWNHFAIVWDRSDDSNSTIYINGKEDNPSKLGTLGDLDTTTTSEDIFFAANSSKLDEFKFFDYTLTPGQIAYEYNRGLPIAHWKFDECQGTTVYDSSGNNHTGTIDPEGSGNTAVGTCNSGTSTEMWNDGTTGKFGASLGFDGTDDEVDIYSSALDSNWDPNHGTLTAWVKVADIGVWSDSAQRNVITLRSGSSNHIYAYKETSANSFSLYRNGGGTVESHSLTTSTTDWFHVAMTWDTTDDEQRYYFNGSLQATDTTIGTFSGNLNSGTTVIGDFATVGNSFEWNGQIDDVRIYNYPLSTAQIQQVMNNGAIRFGN